MNDCEEQGFAQKVILRTAVWGSVQIQPTRKACEIFESHKR